MTVDPETETTTQGAGAGEPQGEAAGSGLSGEELLARMDAPTQEQARPSNPNEDVFARLRNLKAEELPEDIRSKFELPFLQNYTRKYQELSQQQQQLLNAVTSRLEQKGLQPTQTQRQELLDRIKSGEFDALDSFVETAISEKVGPIAQQMAMRTAYEQAQQMHPLVSQRGQEIAQIIQSDPTLSQMAVAENFRYAPQVMAGIAYQLENQALKAQLEKVRLDEVAIARRAVEAYKAKALSLPPTTSKAGSTTSGKTGAQGDMSWNDAVAHALKEMGLG